MPIAKKIEKNSWQTGEHEITNSDTANQLLLQTPSLGEINEGLAHANKLAANLLSRSEGHAALDEYEEELTDLNHCTNIS